MALMSRRLQKGLASAAPKGKVLTKPKPAASAGKSGGGASKPSSDFFRKLANKTDMFEAAAERAMEEGTGGQGLEDGFYICALTNAEIQQSKSSGRPQVVFEWTVVDGDGIGDSHRDYQGFQDEDALTRLNKTFMRLGKDPVRSFEGLQALVQELIDETIFARIQVQTSTGDRGTFTNVRIRKVIQDAEYDIPAPKEQGKKTTSGKKKLLLRR